MTGGWGGGGGVGSCGEGLSNPSAIYSCVNMQSIFRRVCIGLRQLAPGCCSLQIGRTSQDETIIACTSPGRPSAREQRDGLLTRDGRFSLRLALCCCARSLQCQCGRAETQQERQGAPPAGTGSWGP